MFSPHDDEHKGHDLDLEPHHHHQSLVSPPGVPHEPLMHQQPLSLQDVPQPDPFDEPPEQQVIQSDVQHVDVLQHQPPDMQHQHVNPTDLDHQLVNPTDVHQHQLSEPSDIQAPHTSDLHLGDQHEEHDDPLLQQSSKKPRRRYDNNFKAEVIEHLKIPGTKLPQVAKNFGIPENTLREWTKVSVVQSIEAARTKRGGTLKANMFDPLHRLTESLMVFFDRNERQPQHLKQPVTTKLVVAKGIEARNNLLELNEIQPFLDLKEKKTLQAFTGSDSWAKKFAKRHDLKMTGARVKDLGDDDIRNFSAQLRQMASRVKQAGPGYEEAASLMRQASEKLIGARVVTARRMGQPQPQLN